MKLLSYEYDGIARIPTEIREQARQKAQWLELYRVYLLGFIPFFIDCGPICWGIRYKLVDTPTFPEAHGW